MRSATWTSRIAAAGAALAGLSCASEKPPSLLLVTLDTLRVDHVGAYGGSELTPSLDALAAEGLIHEAAYTTMPTTGPAHLSLFTGLYPSEHGGRRNGERLREQHLERELAQRLRRRGYATAAFVTSLMLHPGATGLRGFEVYDAPHGALRHGDDVVSAALTWLQRERRRPVFLWVHLYDPHAPYGSPDEKRLSFPVAPDDYGWVGSERYASPERRRAMAERYARGVEGCDAALGRLVSGVRAALSRPPLVVVAADHGESLTEHLEERGYAYDHGEFLDAESVWIPLVLAGPGVEPGRSSGAVSIRDLYTTLLLAAGLRDARAEVEDRRDLRRRSDARRVLRVERRIFEFTPKAAVRAHAAAATDGSQLVIVGEDGTISRALGPAAGATPAELERAAAGGLEPGSPTGGRAIDPQLRQALEQLGYAQ